MERKEFIKKFAVGGSILFVAPTFLQSCSDGNDEIINDPDNGNPDEIVVDLNQAANSNLKTVGGFVYSGNIIIVRASDSQYIALSKICTHQGCTVKYGAADNDIICECHGSKFTTSGVVTNGPAPTNLKKYTVTVEGNLLKIS